MLYEFGGGLLLENLLMSTLFPNPNEAERLELRLGS